MEPIVSMRQINKQFPNVKAVDNCSLEIRKGEIHSIIGENGAGKSTLMKILYGMYPIDSGHIAIHGRDLEQKSYSPLKAIELGIGMVHQEFMLIQEFTVLENIILGFEPKKTMRRIDFDAAQKMIRHYVEDYKLDVQPNKLIKNIPVGEAQRVEIIKTLYRGAQLLILDEPTAVLTPQETVKLFEILRVMRADGKTIVFISHKLGEVMEISDRITVMRRGRHISTMDKNNVSKKELARLMVGRDVLIDIKKTEAPIGEPVLSVKDLCVTGLRHLSTLKKVSFDIKKGEILGVAGVDGNGQSELIEAITGLKKIDSGQVLLDGKNVANQKPLTIRKAGLTHIPEDRNVRGLDKTFTIYNNLLAGRIGQKPYCRYGTLQSKSIVEKGDSLIEAYDIRPAKGNALVGQLSGGNAQKIVVAREVDMSTKLLIAAQPTRGVDIGAIESIRNIINEVKAKGIAVLLVSADLDEIISLADRIIVMHEGTISGEMPGGDVDIEKLGMWMTGGKTDG